MAREKHQHRPHDALPRYDVERVEQQELPRRGDNELVTVVFPRKSDDVDRAAEEIQQMLGPQGKGVMVQFAWLKIPATGAEICCGKHLRNSKAVR